MSSSERKLTFLRKFSGPIRCHLCGNLLKSNEVTIDHVPAQSLYDLCGVPKEHRRLLPACKKCNNDNGKVNTMFVRLHKLSKRLEKKKYPMPLFQWNIQIKQERQLIRELGSSFVELY